ncbi:hypothetical protein GCM10010521_59610 [Streptomyces rameus]|uniref:Transposase n=1 Tax=Streptomyces rameus TaxID=68261 RepID=A0ABN3V060_9ACTN
MDLDAVADELYGLRPEEFVAARDRHARDAREAGDQSLAREIRALRRPSLAAWVGNLLVRRKPEEVQPLLGLGEQLRRAHRELDGEQLRKLARRQNEVIGALGRQARELAARAGHAVGEGVQREVEETLHAVLADPRAAREWAAGRLVKPLVSTAGFPAADAARLASRPAPAAPEKGKPPRGRDRGADAERRRHLAEARRKAREAERELRARAQDADAAARAVDGAVARSAEADERVGELRERLRQAEEEQRRARAGVQDARERARQAARAAREARRRAETAAAQVERPAAG